MESEKIRRIVAEYRARLRDVLGSGLDSVRLCGFQALEEAEDDSDMDVLCGMREVFDYGDLIGRTSAAAAQLGLR